MSYRVDEKFSGLGYGPVAGMNTAGGAPGNPFGESPAQMKLNEVQNATDSVHEAISRLENRLSLVTVPDGADAKCGPCAPVPVMSPLEHQLECFRASSVSAVYRIEALLNRLAV